MQLTSISSISNVACPKSPFVLQSLALEALCFLAFVLPIFGSYNSCNILIPKGQMVFSEFWSGSHGLNF